MFMMGAPCETGFVESIAGKVDSAIVGTRDSGLEDRNLFSAEIPDTCYITMS